VDRSKSNKLKPSGKWGARGYLNQRSKKLYRKQERMGEKLTANKNYPKKVHSTPKGRKGVSKVGGKHFSVPDCAPGIKKEGTALTNRRSF